MLKIEISGPKNAVREAEIMLEGLQKIEHVRLEEMEEPVARIVLQDLIDENDIRATILVNGNFVEQKANSNEPQKNSRAEKTLQGQDAAS